MASVGKAALVLLVLFASSAFADDRAKQRAEARIFTQIEKYEAWQEEVDRALEALWDRAERLRQMSQRTQHSGKLAPFQNQYEAQWKQVDRTREKGRRILSRIKRACEQIAEQWPPAPPECQEEYQALRDFYRHTRKRKVETWDYLGGE